MQELSCTLQSAFEQSFPGLGVDWQPLAEVCSLLKVKKSHILKEANTIEKNLYLIMEGSAGIFSLKGGKEVCLELCYEGDFFGDYPSMLMGTASKMESRMLENGMVIKIPFQKLLQFYQTLDPIVMEKVGRLSAEFLLIRKNQQLLDLQILTAEERYHKLIMQRPDILQRTAMQHIASFLGITPESFSRIRKKMHGQHFLP